MEEIIQLRKGENMRILVSTTKGGLEDNVSPIFGRCPTFTIVQVEDKKIGKADVIPNPGAQAGGGAGIAAAQAVIDAGADVVITSNCGPNAIGVLSQSGIKVYASTGSVKSAVESLIVGMLSSLESPSVPGHFGMGRGQGMGRGFRGGRQ
jgi:predicted Fe-Mo cluster-binding NifX family protein